MKKRIKKTELIKLILILSVLLLIQSYAVPGGNYTIGNNLEIDMVFVEGGSFKMGDIWNDENDYDDELPVHQVILSDYYLSATEVTNTQYCEFLNEVGNLKDKGYFWLNLDGDMYVECLIEEREESYYPKRGYEDYPVIFVNWYGAIAFCDWISKETGDNYRLPTEAEWEYAARGGGSEDNRYAGIDKENELGEYAWYYMNSNSRIHPVGEKKPNLLGIYDMSGNVCEWCSDWYVEDYYKNSPLENPTGPSMGADRVSRGGGWLDYPWHLRCSDRGGHYPVRSWSRVGFRLCRTGE